MQHGYSGTPLAKKLGLKPGMATLFLDLPEHLRDLTLTEGLARVETRLDGATTRDFDLIHTFETSRERLADRLPALRVALKADGMLWLSWPKKSSGVQTSITEDVLREVILPTGLVDVKVCAVDAVWSGLKFVFRKELRGTLV
ncbi:MAG: DUF3052 domain-containing protein [Hydrogenophaga sp.]|nr:DUF3052 domain-containing protein [Hydrogenophaga sp.]